MDRQNGFTVLELIIAVVVIIAAGAFFYVQKRDLVAANLDSQLKIAANAIYYNLEDIYYPKNKSYPEVLTADQLKGLDPSSLIDSKGKAAGQEGSDFRYEPKECDADGKCKKYTLTTVLQNEANFVRNSRN
jgi:prepilin-type N-terminal cleavage/methylation domain-containing protein